MLNISAFCDASYDKVTKKATACSIVLSDMMFHTMKTGLFEDVDTGARAELLGIIQTMELIKDMEDVESIVIYCDSATTINLYKNILKAGYVNKDTNYYKDWVSLLKLSEGLNINPQSILGHQVSHNPNKICDMMACNTLRLVK